MLPQKTAIRSLPVLARDHPASARGAAQEAGALRGSPAYSLYGIAETLRIHPHAEGPRPLSDRDVDRPLGQRAYGRLPRQAVAPRAQELRQDVRSDHGVLRVRRASKRQAGARSSGAGPESRGSRRDPQKGQQEEAL